MAQIEMTLLRCMVRLRGSLDNVVPPADRGFGPGIVSWPEAILLKHLHEADDCLEHVVRVGKAFTTPREEKARLVQIYGDAAVDQLYPGAVPQMEFAMPVGAEDAVAEAEAQAEAERRSLTVPRFVIEEAPQPAAPVLSLSEALPVADPEMDDEAASAADDILDVPDPAVDGGAVTTTRRRRAATG